MMAYLRMLCLLMAFCMILPFMAYGGTVSGRVTESGSDDALPGANVLVWGTRLSAVTDRGGRFRIQGISEGVQHLEVSYIGYYTRKVEIRISGAGTVVEPIALNVNPIALSTMVIEGLRQRQMQALNQQKTAENIKNVVAADLIGRFPDPNTAEAIQRIPGVSVRRDQGEGRLVQVRGTEARLTSVMINGDQLPSPEGEIRSVALDVIPADQIATIELNKALTPDMDADGIGGAINLVTRKALEQDAVLN